MKFQTVFKRYELKYKITRQQKDIIKREMEPFMMPDKYGKTNIRNIYFDTDNYRLIRASIEKPMYKEKLRIRSYGKATPDSTVFVELKKKYDGVVFKRRLSLTESEAIGWVSERGKMPDSTQIANEIEYFLDFYEKLHPAMFISYDREAYYSNERDDFRITFDENILCRGYDLTLTEDAYGDPILPEDEVIMEVKCAGAVPLWLTEILSREKIYKSPFSKYGTAYENIVFPKIYNKKNLPKETEINA